MHASTHRSLFLSSHLENYIPLVKVAIFGRQSCSGHFLDEDLTPQPETIL